jgi:hypothetical protein
LFFHTAGAGLEAADVGRPNPVVVQPHALEQLGALLEGRAVSPTGLLDVQLRSYLLDLRRRIASGERVPSLRHDRRSARLRRS